MSYRHKSNYAGDPRWITAKYAGIDAKGTPFAKGDQVFYFPSGKRLYAGAAGDEASRRFESERADEDVYNGYGSAY